MRTATTVRGAAQVFTVLVGTAVILLPGGPLGPLPAAAAAQVITACPGPGNPITVDTELGADLVAAPGDDPCVQFGADKIRLRLRGFAIDMRNVPGATAIAITGRNNVGVIGDDGFVLTRSGVGISVTNGSNVEIREVRVRNNVPAGPPSTTPCAPASGTDRGIRLQGVIGARVIENLVECYGIGVEVSTSTGGGNKENLIGRNIIQNNAAVLCPLPETEIVCTAAGLGLSSSSGWLVLRNTVTDNGRGVSLPTPGIVLTGSTTTANEVLRNVVDNNTGGGITIPAPGPAGNLFERNHATGNGPVLAQADLEDNNTTVVNVWNPNNICNFQQGAGIPTGVCNPGEM
jgi:hypothetical protein